MKQILQSLAWLLRGCRDPDDRLDMPVMPDVVLPDGTMMDYKLSKPQQVVKLYRGYIATHPEAGLFIGCALGLAFWSKLEDGGQRHAPIFESIDEMQAFLSAGHDAIFMAAVTYHHVVTKDSLHASISEIRRADPPVPEDALAPLLPNQLH
jgi:hypothetical protein